MNEDWETELAAVKERVAGWQDEFISSTFYKQLTEVEQQEMDFIIDAVVDFSYRYFDAEPTDLTPQEVKRCCVEIIPSKVAADDDFFNSLPGVLSAFFEFLASRGILAQGEELAQAVRSVREEITAAAADNANWNPGKKLFHAAEEAGVDVTDEQELEEFINAYNERQQGQFEAEFKQSPKRNDSEWDVGRNDPCPCGSGKKYKKCCLPELKRQRPYNRALSQLLDKLFDFFLEIESFYRSQIDDYFDYFARAFGLSGGEMPEEAQMLAIFNLIFDYQLSGEQTVLKIFKEQREAELPSKQREVLNSLLEQRLKSYQIVDQQRNSYQLANLVEDKTVSIIERDEELQPGNIVIGRVAKIGRENQLVGFYDTVSAQYKDLIKEEVEELAADFKTQQLTMDWDQFWRKKSLELLGILNDAAELEMREVETVRQVIYALQAPEVVRKRLTSQANIVVEETEEDFTVLSWFVDEEVGPEVEIKGRFIIDDATLTYITPFASQIAPGKGLIESELSFTVEYKEEYDVDPETEEIVEWITRSSEVSNEIIEGFITSPLPTDDEIGGKTPQELVKTETDRKKLKNYLNQMELVAEYIRSNDPNFFQVNEIKQIKRELGIPVVTEQVIRDGVEQLIADKMQLRDFSGEMIRDSILLWRDYKQAVESFRGQDRSWAGAVEYLLGCLNTASWSPTQSEVAAVYDVSENTISKKYRRIAEELDLSVSKGWSIFN